MPQSQMVDALRLSTLQGLERAGTQALQDRSEFPLPRAPT